MDPPRFFDHYRVLITCIRRSGLPTPWIEKPHTIAKVLYLIYDSIIVIMLLYSVVCYMYSIMTATISFQDLCSLGLSGGCFVCALLINVCQIQFRTELKRVTDTMDSIAKRIIESELADKDLFEQEYKNNAAFINNLIKYTLMSMMTTPFLYFLSLPVFEWYAGNYKAHFPVPIENFFNDRLPGVYELIVITIAASISYSSAQKASNDCLFISLFKIQTSFLRYLTQSKKVIEKELLSGNSVKSQKKLLIWVELHQEIIKNIKELVLIFSPILIVYYVMQIEIVVCGAFVELKKDNDNMVQSISVGSYVTLSIIYYYILSNTADELTTEAQKLVFMEYNLPWYKMDKRNASMVKMIMTMCNVPVEITAYYGPTFLLNRENFAGFMFATLSAFLTLCQMKDVYG
nr:odorant receptor 39 [Graphosoma rubrolineatum]